MNLGLGLPIGRPESLLTWARRADAGPFRTLGLLDRLVYHNPEPLVALAAIAGATTRIRVQTEVLLAPLRETALLAKQAATLDRMSGGRFTLGLGIGGREDDHAASGTDLRTRGRRLDEQLATLRELWAGEPFSAEAGPIGPRPLTSTGPELLFGAFAPPALARVAKWGDGVLSAVPLAQTDSLFRTVESSWQQAGRAGKPRLVAQLNVACGPESVLDDARRAITEYYAFSPYGRNIAERVLTTPEQIQQAAAGFAELGTDELMLYCWADDPDQVDRLADLLS